MKTKKHIRIGGALGLLAWACLVTSPSLYATPSPPTPPWPKISVKDWIVPGAGSPAVTASFGNIIAYVAKYGVVGNIPTNYPSDPTALNELNGPHVLRACQICASPSGGSFYLHDATNNPGAAFTNQYGERLAWSLDWSDTNRFLVSSLWFKLWSTDYGHTLGYAGNVGTNTSTGMPQTFSSTFVGEVWNSDGTITSLHNGEPATTPVNRIVTLIRIGYTCADLPTLTNTLAYFKNAKDFVAYASFYSDSGSGTTNALSSRVWINPPAYRWDPVRWTWTATLRIEGQRQLGFNYTLIKVDALEKRLPFSQWTVVSPGAQPEGWFVDDTAEWLTSDGGANYYLSYAPHFFYVGVENNGPVATPSVVTRASSVSQIVPAPSAVGSNGE